MTGSVLHPRREHPHTGSVMMMLQCRRRRSRKHTDLFFCISLVQRRIYPRFKRPFRFVLLFNCPDITLICVLIYCCIAQNKNTQSVKRFGHIYVIIYRPRLFCICLCSYFIQTLSTNNIQCCIFSLYLI